MGIRFINGYYYIDYYDGSRRVRESVGKSKKLAEQALAQRLSETSKRKHLGLKTDERITLEEFIPRYMEKPGRKEKTLRSDKLSLRHLSKFFGKYYLFDITTEGVEHFKAARGGRPGSINRDLSILSALLNTAVEWGIISKVPAKIKKLREAKDRIRYLTHDEKTMLFLHLSPHLKNIVKVALYTGMRKGELLALRWQNIDMENKQIFVREEITETWKRETTKSYRQRTIPISAKLLKVLEKLPRDKEDLFLHLGDFKKAWLTSLRRAGIKDFRFHDLRGTAASYMIMNGVNVVTVKEILGHQSLEVTMRYIKLALVVKSKAVEILAESFEIDD